MSIDAKRVALDFGRASSAYEKEAHIQFSIMSQLLELSAPYIEKNARVLDIGCGTGWLSDALAERHIEWQLHGIDIAHSMCKLAQPKQILTSCASAESLPYANASCDAIFSSLCVQWLDNPQHFLRESARVLKPGGRVAIATLGAHTLKELRDTFALLGEESRVMQFRSEFDWLDMALSEGFTMRHMHHSIWKNPYDSMQNLCKTLRAIGAVNKRVDRKRGFTGTTLFAQACNHYNAEYKRTGGEYNRKAYGGGVWASWQPVFLMFEKPK